MIALLYKNNENCRSNEYRRNNESCRSNECCRRRILRLSLLDCRKNIDSFSLDCVIIARRPHLRSSVAQEQANNMDCFS